MEAIAAAFHLADEDGMAAVVRRRKGAKGAKGEQAARIDEFVGQVARDAGVKASAFAGGDAPAWGGKLMLDALLVDLVPALRSIENQDAHIEAASTALRNRISTLPR